MLDLIRAGTVLAFAVVITSRGQVKAGGSSHLTEIIGIPLRSLFTEEQVRAIRLRFQISPTEQALSILSQDLAAQVLRKAKDYAKANYEFDQNHMFFVDASKYPVGLVTHQFVPACQDWTQSKVPSSNTLQASVLVTLAGLVNIAKKTTTGVVPASAKGGYYQYRVVYEHPLDAAKVKVVEDAAKKGIESLSDADNLQILELLEQDGMYLYHLPNHTMDHALAAVKQNGDAYQFVDPSLRRNLQLGSYLAILAVRYHHGNMFFVPEELKSNFEFAKRVFPIRGGKTNRKVQHPAVLIPRELTPAVHFMPTLMATMNFITWVMRVNCSIIQFVDPKMIDKQFAVAAARKFPFAIRFVGELSENLEVQAAAAQKASHKAIEKIVSSVWQEPSKEEVSQFVDFYVCQRFPKVIKDAGVDFKQYITQKNFWGGGVS